MNLVDLIAFCTICIIIALCVVSVWYWKRRRTLLDAIFYLDSAQVRRCLRRGEDINARDEYGCSALHAAIESQQCEIALMLIEAGALLDVKDRCGRTPASIAANVPPAAIDAHPETWAKIKETLGCHKPE